MIKSLANEKCIFCFCLFIGNLDTSKYGWLSYSKCDRWRFDIYNSKRNSIKIRFQTVNSINECVYVHFSNGLHWKRNIVSFYIIPGNENMHKRDLIQSHTIFGVWLNSTLDMSSYHIHIHSIKICLSNRCYVISCVMVKCQNQIEHKKPNPKILNMRIGFGLGNFSVDPAIKLINYTRF